MTSHYIQTLGVAKCREILKGAPVEATLFQMANESPCYLQESNGDWFWFNSITGEWCVDYSDVRTMFDLKDLRHELSTYDTDDFTHLANHISPLTIVIEEVLQEQFQEANEAGEGR